MSPLLRTLFLAVLGTGAAALAGAQPDWRLSDALGSDLGPAARGKGTAGWVLRIEARAGTEERTLFRDGREDSVRLVDRGPDGRVLRLRDLRAGQLLWAVDYDPQTAYPSAETSFQDGQPAEIAALEFAGGLLVRRTVRDGAGELLYTDTLGHWPDGSLRRLERDGPAGPLAEAAWSYGPGRKLTRAWLADEGARAQGEHRSWAYAPGKTEETLARGAEVLESRVTEWLEAGTSRETRVRKDTGRTEVLAKDPQGRILEATVTEKEKVVQTRKWAYDGQGRLTEASTESAGPREVLAYDYRADGTVLKTLHRGEVRVREDLTREGEVLEVRYYDRGDLFLVETWSGGKRAKEAYYRNGALVRERTP